MPASRRAVLLLIATLASPILAAADPGWQPLVTQDVVSVRERSSPGRSLPELQATTEIDAGIFDVLAVISDVSRQTEWMHDCEESRLLRSDGADASLIYNRTSAPWPVSDRDVILRTETTLITPGQKVALRFANTTDPSAPPVDGVVRMPRLVGGYDLAALTPTRTQVIYHLDIDPGGSLPTWAVTRTTRDTPLHTLLGLRKQVDATRGKYAAFVAAWSLRR